MLHKNTIRSDKSELNESVTSILKQKPNRKILGIFRFHLGVYNLANRGKQTKFKSWVKRTIGEEPVVLDSVLTEKSREQVKQFLQNNGYFNAVVTDTTTYLRRKRAHVTYRITTGNAYTLRYIFYKIDDPAIKLILLNDSAASLVKTGNNYSTSDFQHERDRITTLLRNRGYYDFSQAYISFDVDTSLKSQQTDVFFVIKNPLQVSYGDTLPLHKVYRIDNIYIQTDYDPLAKNLKIPTDTVVYKNYHFTSSFKKMRFKPEALLSRIFIEKGDLYKVNNADYTYKGLANLGLFRFVNIRYEPVATDSSNYHLLNSFISLSPSAKQDYKVELEGTHNGGNFGVGGNLTYRNKNSFRSAELIELKIRAKIESIPDFVDSTSADQPRPLSLNTYEIGPELNIRIPRLLWPLARFNHSRSSNPVTNFTSSFNYQKRPEYTRNNLVFSSGFEFKESKYKKHFVYPAEINYSSFNLSQAFVNKLVALNDLQLILYYRNYLITNGRYTFIYNSQEQNLYRDFVYFRFSFEIAGNSLRLIDKLRTNYDENKTYQVLGINYSQYIRPDFDFSYYQIFSSHTALVYRLAAGIGMAYLNSDFIPYEKTFFAGGANDLRAFRARTIGPGSYAANNFIEQLGDIKINANVEYRFDIFRILEGAIFADAGNIWLRDNFRELPGSRFQPGTFLSELALGTGIGMRLDFTFFIFRIDAGIPLKDPGRAANDRWVINYLKLSSINYNFGIGYPF
ncbi:MAG: BamA/TamA family outer membrane protein [Bacteroidetes bacterium]|nr:BamA/TamA family outer membrane protein [Bacteroidota bacterium]MBK9046331.1 BamA/TamA family outer membrane protein [Bacteroidota bacterium]MBK9424919.1 BamA/TamA family outer membrane protein [Bacteroidota bacterium]